MPAASSTEDEVVTYIGGSEFQINVTTENYQSDPYVANVGDGNIVFVWESTDFSTSNGYGQIRDESGQIVEEEFTIGSGFSGNVWEPEVVPQSYGDFYISWYSGSSTEVLLGYADTYAQWHWSDGTILSNPFSYSTSGTPDFDLLRGVHEMPGDLLVFVQYQIEYYSNTTTVADTDLAVTIFSGDGSSILVDETLVGSFNEDWNEGGYALAGVPEGGFLMVWGRNNGTNNSEQIRAGFFDANGQSDGSDLYLGPGTTPDVARLTDGTYIVVWQSQSYSYGEAGTSGIFGQRLAADGTEIGGRIHINTTTAGDQFAPNVAALDSGGFVVTWTSENLDDPDWGIAARYYTEDGEVTGEPINLIEGDATADSLTGTADDDIINGNAGGDTITGGAGDDELNGNDGDDNLDGGDDDDILSGGTGNDTLSGGGGNDQLSGGQDNDSLTGAAGSDTLYGDAGTDVLTGDAGGDRLYGGTHNDNIDAGAGNDVIYGDHGADTIDGGDGTDAIQYLASGSGVTVDLSTGTGSAGQAAGDVISNIENINGSRASDHLTGDDGDNKFVGYGGWDTLEGGDGDDRLEGWAGHDILDGGAGNDVLLGGKDNDTLDGGAGDDTLTGGTNRDVFVFTAGTGDDTVTDFNTELDTLDLSATTTDFTDSASVEAAASAVDGGLLIDLGGGDSVLLEGLTLSDIADIEFSL